MRALALFPLLLAACGDAAPADPDPAGAILREAETAVRWHLESARVVVASVTCEEASSTASAELGAVIRVDRCAVEQPVGEAFEVTVEHAVAAEPDGTPTVARSAITDDVVIVTALEDRIAERFSEAGGVPLTVACGVPPVIPAVPGETFDCVLGGGPAERGRARHHHQRRRRSALRGAGLSSAVTSPGRDSPRR